MNVYGTSPLISMYQRRRGKIIFIFHSDLIAKVLLGRWETSSLFDFRGERFLRASADAAFMRLLIFSF